MKNNFLENAQMGKNEWWRYLLTIVVMVLFASIFTVAFAKGIMPLVKANFEKTSFAETIVNFIMIFITFGTALLGLAVMVSKLHKRSFATLLHYKSNFSWKLWFLGFLSWLPFILGLSFLTGYDGFERFQAQNYSLVQLVIVFLVGLFSVGIQSTAEEILFRGYLLQGMSLKIKKIMLLVSINSLVFALMHMGYGFDSLIQSFAFAVVFALVVLHNKRIEFSAGAHTVNNLIILVFFPMEDTKEMSQFNWEIDWLGLVYFLVAITVFYLLVRYFMKSEEKNVAVD